MDLDQHSLLEARVQGEGNFGNTKNLTEKTALEPNESKLHCAEALRNHKDPQTQVRKNSSTKIGEASPAQINSSSTRYRKSAHVPHVSLVDISRPMRVKRGEGDPVEDPVFVNLSFPVSMPLPGFDMESFEPHGMQSEESRWLFINSSSGISNLDPSSLLEEETLRRLGSLDWFHPGVISAIERNFLLTGIPDCKDYLRIRNMIIRSYYELPHIRLSISSVASRLPSYNIFHISQIHAFLQDWGIINTEHCTGPHTCLPSSCSGLLRKRLLTTLGAGESAANDPGQAASSRDRDEVSLVYNSLMRIASQPSSRYVFQYQRLGDSGNGSRAESQGTNGSASSQDGVPLPFASSKGLKCFMCTRECTFIAYRHLDLPLIICPSCFKDGRFAMDMPSSVFSCLGVTPMSNLVEPKAPHCCDGDCDIHCEGEGGEWNDEMTLQLLCSIEKDDELNWSGVSDFINSLNQSNSRMNLRRTPPLSQDSRLRACRKYSKKSPPKTQEPTNIAKKQKISEFDPVDCAQRFLSLHHADSVLGEPLVKKSLLGSSKNLVMTLLSTIHYILGGEIAAAGAMKGLELLSRNVSEKYAKKGRTFSLDEADQDLSILKQLPDGNLIHDTAVEVLKGSAEEARTMAWWEDMAVELLIHQIIDLECKKICCKTKLVQLLDQG